MQLGIARGRRRRPAAGLMGDFSLLASSFRRPLFVRGSALVYIPSRVKANSKTAAAVAELSSAGIAPARFLTSDKTAWDTVNCFLGGLRDLPWTVYFILMMRWRTPRLGGLERFLVLTRGAYRRFLRRHPSLVPLIISDVGPDRIALWSAAVAEKRPVFWWQDDRRHNEKLSYPVDFAAILNLEGYENVAAISPSAFIATRPEMRPVPFRPLPDSPRAGIATNSFFRASPEERRQLSSIRELLRASSLYLRLHPNSKIEASNLPEEWITVASPQEPLDEFAEKTDIAVVGNSTVQIKLLCRGLPVMHFPFGDPRGFDKHGYHAMGLTYGAPAIESLSLEGVRHHYADPELPKRIAAYIQLPAGTAIHGLEELASHISRSAIHSSP